MIHIPLESLQLPAHCRHAAAIVHVHWILSLLGLTENKVELTTVLENVILY
jgi:hypothetical protein